MNIDIKSWRYQSTENRLLLKLNQIFNDQY